ncbi:hypothetical protein JTB14_014573 [Gonioctena quinquepunctata]|nr:hypothetical protein JTB14_014573 [Gonioctena quinquepunctata]
MPQVKIKTAEKSTKRPIHQYPEESLNKALKSIEEDGTNNSEILLGSNEFVEENTYLSQPGSPTETDVDFNLAEASYAESTGNSQFNKPSTSSGIDQKTYSTETEPQPDSSTNNNIMASKISMWK